MLGLDLDGAVVAAHVERRHGLLAEPERLAGAILERARRAVLQPQQARREHGEAHAAGAHDRGGVGDWVEGEVKIVKSHGVLFRCFPSKLRQQAMDYGVASTMVAAKIRVWLTPLPIS